MKVGSLVCVSHNQNSEEFVIDMQRFTKTGIEFIRFVSPNERYMIDFFRRMKTKYPKLELTAHRIVGDSGDMFTYTNTSLI